MYLNNDTYASPAVLPDGPLDPRRVADAPFDNKPGVAIVGAIDRVCRSILEALQHQGIYVRLFPHVGALMAYADAPTLGMGIIVGSERGSDMPELLASLRSRGMQRAVLVGPSPGEGAYAQALETGFDEVWPERLDPPTLRALMNKAWQTTLKLVKPSADRVPTLGELVLHPESCSCSAADTVAYLSRSCFAVLQCLVLKYPRAVSRADLFMALGKVVPGLDARSRAVDMAVHRLRKQLADGQMKNIEIKTVEHVGYSIRYVHKLHSFPSHLGLARH